MQQHQDEENDLQIPTSKRSTEQQDGNIFNSIFGMIYNFIWASLFLIFRYYNKSECQVIDQWTKYAQVFLFLVAGYKLIIELPIQSQKINNIWAQSLFTFMNGVELVISLIITAGLTYAYFQFEDCFHLRAFVLVYLIVTYLILLIFILSAISELYSRKSATVHQSI